MLKIPYLACQDVCAKVAQSRTKEIATVDHEIVQLEQLRDSAAVTEALFVTQRENVLLEAQLAEVTERQSFFSSIKSRLDDAVRKAEEKAAREKQEYIEAIMSGVIKELKDPKLQDKILKKCLADLEHIPSQALQPSA